MKRYTLSEEIRLIIPKWIWALGAMGYMVILYIGMPIMALYGLFKLIK